MKRILCLILVSAAGVIGAGGVSAETVIVDIPGFNFSPDDITITAGTTVRWVNQHSMAHTSTHDGGLWDSGLLDPDESFDRTFNTPGTFSYHCTPHPFMTGVVRVQASTDVGDDTGVALPGQIRLEQNHPNPFNPSTKISFTLPRFAEVKLTVYSILGAEVAVLANKTFAAGRHEITWDGRGQNGRPVSSGIYFYQITAGEFRETRKMTLLK